MWKITVAPVEDVNAWESFREQGIIGIGWCGHGPGYDSNPAVVAFRDEIRVGDWVIAHLPRKRSGQSFLVVGLGRITGNCAIVLRSALPSGDGWTGNFRRQRSVDWLSTIPHRMPAELSRCYRITVCRLGDVPARRVLHRYGVNV